MPYLLTTASLDFEHMEFIGSGGDAEVFKSFDPQLNRICAHKAIPLSKFSRIDDYFDEARKIFHSKHHNVVEIFYGCKTADKVYLAMPFYKKGSMKALIDSRNLTAQEIIRYALQFLSGLNNIHAKGVLHFDFKPENILISNSNTALITDFGIAQYMRGFGLTRTQQVTPAIATPEYFDLTAPHSVRYDIYQVGLTLYRMCYTEKRFQDHFNRIWGSSRASRERNLKDAILSGAFPNRTFYLPHIPSGLRKIIKRAIELDPADRYSTVFEMLNDLSKLENVQRWAFVDGTHDQVWTRSGDSVTASFNGSTWNVVAKRNGRKNNDFCDVGMTEGGKNLLLTKCFKEWNE
jgi:eukaryotic-like serine/threonine-protein kinase